LLVDEDKNIDSDLAIGSDSGQILWRNYQVSVILGLKRLVHVYVNTFLSGCENSVSLPSSQKRGNYCFLGGPIATHGFVFLKREKQICAKENIGESRKGSICGLGLLFEQVGIARDIADLASCMYATLYKTSDVDIGQL
jgi:hypothetical protein